MARRYDIDLNSMIPFITELWDAGLTLEDIGGRLGCSGRAVALALERNGGRPPRYEAWTLVECHGYVGVKIPGSTGTFLAHRLAAEVHFRQLRPGEIVHHINENKRDNRPANLEILPSISFHMKHHNPGPGDARCSQCSADAWTLAGRSNPLCRKCFNHLRRYHQDGRCSSSRRCPLTCSPSPAASAATPAAGHQQQSAQHRPTGPGTC